MKTPAASPRPQSTPFIPHFVQASVRNLGPDTNLLKTFEILVAAAAGMAALLALFPAAGHDQLWFLLMAQRWLDGATLYGPYLFDSNPPLIVWLSAVPVFFGEQLRLPVPAIAKLLVLVAEAGSATLSLSFLRRLRPGLSTLQLLWLAFASIVIFAVVPARDFGQRDHLTAVLCLPYILAAALNLSPGQYAQPRRPGDRLPRICAAVLAGVGVCLKPHQALIPIAVELTRLLLPRIDPDSSSPTRPQTWRGLLRLEPPILLLAGLAFLGSIRCFAPLYFTLALPTLRDTYWAIGHLTPFQLCAESLELHLLGLLTLAFFLFRRSRPDPLRPAITLLLAGALAATAAYYLQGTGWYYQQLPALSLFGSALALQALGLHVHLRDTRWLPRATLALAVLALALTTHFTGYPFTPDRSFAITSPDPTFFSSLPPGTPIALITTSVDDSMMPVARYHLLWAQRTNNVWTLPAILRSEDPQGTPPRHAIPPARLSALAARQHAWMAEDLDRWQPKLILVARCQAPEVRCQELEDRHDNLLAWFLRDPAFAHIWRHYRLLRTSGAYDAYTRTD